MNERDTQLATYYVRCVSDLRTIIASIGYDGPVMRYEPTNLAHCINSWIAMKHAHIIEDILAERRKVAN